MEYYLKNMQTDHLCLLLLLGTSKKYKKVSSEEVCWGRQHKCSMRIVCKFERNKILAGQLTRISEADPGPVR